MIMRKGLWTKGLVFGIILLFVGTSMTSTISGNIGYKGEISETRDIIFSDDFNDNQKDYNKWNEIYSNGTWEETNGRTEFKLIESGGTGVRSEGIQSKSVVAAIGGDEPWDNRVKLTWTMYPKIDATSSEGKIAMKITDGRNYIVMEYDRIGGIVKSYDSLGNEEVCIGGDEPWDNKLEISGDRYFVTMNDWEATVYASIFTDRSIMLNIQLFMELGGSTRDKYLRSGFDDIIMSQLTGNQPPIAPTITGPAKGIVKVATRYNFTTTDPDGDEVSYFIDWGDGTNSSWIGPYTSGNLISKSHTWTKKGDYTIKAKAKDSYGNESGWGTLKITMPRSFSIPFDSFLERLFERFPHLFPILRHLLGY
jgi:hypothetical protein